MADGPAPVDASSLVVDADGICFTIDREQAQGPLNLLFDDRRVWSFHVTGTALREDCQTQMRFQPWPDALRPYLNGRCEVALARPGADEAMRTTTAQFGSSTEPLTFADAQGHPLVIDKWLRLGRVFDDLDDDTPAHLLDGADAIIAVLQRELGLGTYITYGTLLGSVRAGRLIGHDDDVDLGYLSRHTHPADVATENYAIGRALRQAGFEVQRLSAGHLQLHFQRNDHTEHHVDVFTSWFVGGWWHQLFCVRARLTRGDLLPIRDIDVEGRAEPAPAVPERMLEAIYGPGWRVPDPAFRFETPQATAARLFGWGGDVNMHREFWQDLYHNEEHDDPPDPDSDPSPFARWVAESVDPTAPIVELGCGRGQDAVWFAGHGHQVHAVDYVRPVIATAARIAESHALPVVFEVLNFYDIRTTVTFGANLAARREPYMVYAHGVLAALNDGGRITMFRLLSMLLRNRGRAYLDFVAPRPEGARGPVDERRHRYIRLARLRQELSRVGLRIAEHTACGDDDGIEDGRLMRMVVEWAR